MLRIELQPAFILHGRPYQETSLLLEIFSEKVGRFCVIAKGARRPKSRARGLLQPFVPLLISCRGRGELLTLTGYEAYENALFLQGRSLIFAFYLNELLMRLMIRFDPHPELFHFYKASLNNLILSETGSEDNQITLRLFEKALLKEMGYEVHLTQEMDGAVIEPDKFYHFNPEKGFSQATDEFLSESLFKGEHLLAFAKDQLKNGEELLTAKRLMRRAISVHLGGRPLESRRLL